MVAIQQPRLYTSYPSPDGKWRVDITIYDCIKIRGGDEAGSYEYSYEQLILMDPATGEQQLADDQLIACGGLGGYGFDGRFWSANNRYFYYTNAREGGPDGCGGYWSPPFLRLDVTDMITTYLGIGPRSPDEVNIAAQLWNDQESRNELRIWDIEGGESTRLPMYVPDVLMIGPIAWSLDGQRLVYIQVENSCPVSGKSYLVLVDVTTQEQTLLLVSESPTFGGVEWNSINVLSLFDENGNEWRYNLLTHELNQIP